MTCIIPLCPVRHFTYHRLLYNIITTGHRLNEYSSKSVIWGRIPAGMPCEIRRCITCYTKYNNNKNNKNNCVPGDDECGKRTSDDSDVSTFPRETYNK